MSKPHQSDDSNTNIDSVESKNTVNSSESSSADNVDRHLQTLEATSKVAIQRQLSPEEQLFTEEELARLVNPDKLKALMNNGDDFLGYLTGEIDKFEK
ncbi:hypothetical protein [Psychrobacter sanguinis]|uniref:hypothetical protein n=1 Tax=Psychrobacter sanguinis TaxID=861445 RepID=UPI00191A5D8D|nr:hypothetical protein [Psychrobacter sanguinis]MCC3306918.1 hypothetical protein [Psychrobacter sanguinis]UEC26772.1 hypothetical protein LK453_06735 [Psychrobacter sanguinis]